MTLKKYKSVDEYHSTFPPMVIEKLEQLNRTIRRAAPESEEVISYNMPAFKQGRGIVSYAAYKRHIGFYAGSSPVIIFKDELTKFKT